MTSRYIPEAYTVESVTSGHPDKVCDQISDAILDACLAQDPNSRVAVECFGSHGLLVIGGEVTTAATVDYAATAGSVYRAIGHTDEIEILNRIVAQSPEIAAGVNNGGAGDQGMMYGYATNETDTYLPKGLVYTHKLAKGLEERRRNGRLPWVRPDGKTQVTMQNGRVHTVLVSTQHDEDIQNDRIRDELTRMLIREIIDETPEKIFINPSGSFVKGGFDADAGLTGRKIMVDTYGGLIQHGGGAFSGKDATKVDRSAAYMARYVAREIVKSGDAKECLVAVAYAIGVVDPVMVRATDEQGNDISDKAKAFDFRPLAIIERLGLRKPIFLRTANRIFLGGSGKKERSTPTGRASFFSPFVLLPARPYRKYPSLLVP
jgi:S-adenosylmethionine synthetase